MPSIPHSTLHERVERILETGDLRLIYGLGVPMLVIVAGVAALALAQAMWLVPALLAAVVALTGIVIVGLSQMLDDSDDSDGPL